MGLVKAEGFILKNIPYKDNSRILTIYTKEYGKISAISYGSQKLVSANNSSTQIGNLVNCLMYAKEDNLEMGSISQIDVLNEYRNIKLDYKKSVYMQYFLEIVERNTEMSDRSRELYELLKYTFQQINSNDEKLTRSIRNYFEFHFLQLLGFGFQPDRCIHCNTLITEGFWKPKVNGIVCVECNKQVEGISKPLELDHIALLKYMSLGLPENMFTLPKFVNEILDVLMRSNINLPVNSIKVIKELFG